jgi:hypothetical protein
MRFSRTPLLLYAAAITANLAHAALPDFLPPETKVVFGFSLRGLIDSPLIAGLKDAKISTATLMAGSPLAKVDPLKDIDDVIIATTGEGQNPPTLIVAHGRFPSDLMPPGGKIYGGVPIFEDAKTSNGSFALLDSGTLLGGDLAMVHAAIDRRGMASSLAPALIERIQSLESRYDFWGLGDLPKGMPATAGSAAPAELQAIDHFEFGASLRHGLDLGGQIHVRSTKDAEKMMQMIQFLAAMMKAQPSNTGTKFDLQSDHDTIKFSLSISEEELKKGIAAQKANLASAFFSGMKSAAPKPVVITTSPTPGSIVKNERGDAVTVTLPRRD